MRPRHLGVLALAALCPVAALARGSEVVRGDGKVTAQKRELPAFDAVRLETAADVAVKVGPPQSVTVKIDGNLQELLQTTVAKVRGSGEISRRR
ncbi:MAG TPA: hypothetical protein VIV57_10295 [Anaeromyxobacter sp.]